MRRMAHGFTDPIDIGAEARSSGVESLLAANAIPAPTTPFDYRFDVTADPLGLLPESNTLQFLSDLGASMRDPGENALFDSYIPSAYTYFGQFLDHDITFTNVEKDPTVPHSCVLGAPNLAPWPKAEVLKKVTNKRHSILQLDCVYGKDITGNDPPRKGPFMVLGHVSPDPDLPTLTVKDDERDLPRNPISSTPTDRVARIGDARNDQNLVISQLHVAFLRAHNATVNFLRANRPVAPAQEFAEAQKRLRQHYHWIVIHDFLKQQLAYPGIVEQILKSIPSTPVASKFFLPLEFTIAAFRFGHSMIRRLYYLNDEYPFRSLTGMFTLTALSNALGPTPGKGFPTLPVSKIIHWRKFLAGKENRNRARQINTRMVEPLFTLLDEKELPVPCEQSLAVQDLKRGYMMRMPTGQAVARQLSLPVMTEAELASVAAANQQIDLLSGTDFARQTPLWFYILAEATHYSLPEKPGSRLGPVGTRLIADVLIDLVRRSDDSILNPALPKPWTPYLGTTPGTFDLKDLLEFAGVLEP